MHATILLATLWVLHTPVSGLAEQGVESNGPPETKQETVDPRLAKMLASPRSTVVALITHVNQNDNMTAAHCLDLAHLGPVAGKQRGGTLAYRLKAIMDRLRRIDQYRIPNKQGTQSPYLLGDNHLAKGPGHGKEISASFIYLTRGEDELWRFSAETVDAIDELWERWRDEEHVAGLTASQEIEPFDDRLRKFFPPHLRETHFLLPSYKWVYLLVVIFVGFLADAVIRAVLGQLNSLWLKRQDGGDESRSERKLWRPIGLMAQALVWYGGTSVIDLPNLATTILLVGLKIFSVVTGVWTGFLLINLLAAYLARKALQSESKFDDLLIPLVSKSLKLFVIMIGVLTCAQTFSLPMAGLLGGSAIGGMALALASKDAVSNFFGSITVLVDRPFEIGDWIVMGDVEGTVETVGFRSTRIRTFYNSQITVPNSNLTTAIVDNMGRRRYRRIKALLGVQYDTTPEQIEAFCEGIRELLRRHPYTRKDYFHVYFNEYGDSSLNILLYCFVDCPDWATELREKHRLLLDIFKLADRLGVSFAFPTRTLHLYQEQHASNSTHTDLSDPRRAGQQIAAHLAGQNLPVERRPGPV